LRIKTIYKSSYSPARIRTWVLKYLPQHDASYGNSHTKQYISLFQQVFFLSKIPDVQSNRKS